MSCGPGEDGPKIPTLGNVVHLRNLANTVLTVKLNGMDHQIMGGLSLLD